MDLTQLGRVTSRGKVRCMSASLAYLLSRLRHPLVISAWGCTKSGLPLDMARGQKRVNLVRRWESLPNGRQQNMQLLRRLTAIVLKRFTPL
jgi:hypothetical protein